MVAFVKFCTKKTPKSIPFPFFSALFFFLKKIHERLNKIRQIQKAPTSTSIDFTHVKRRLVSSFTMYGRKFRAALPNPDLGLFAIRPPVNSKCTAVARASYFVRSLPVSQNSFTFLETPPTTVYKVLSTLKASKAAGLDNVPAGLLKFCAL